MLSFGGNMNASTPEPKIGPKKTQGKKEKYGECDGDR
jgi:hypothetical protein